MEKKHSRDEGLLSFYIDNGRSILRFFFLASLICFVIFMLSINSTVMQTNINASRMCLKYKETAEKTRKAIMTSFHITKTTTSTLHQEEKNKQKSSIIYRLGFVCKEKIIQKKNHRITLKIDVFESQKQNFSMHIMWSLKLSEHNSPSPFNQNIIFPSIHLLQGKKWKW